MNLLDSRLSRLTHAMADLNGVRLSGRLKKLNGTILEASGPMLPAGSGCFVEALDGSHMDAEIVGFDENTVKLMTLGNPQGLRPGAKVLAQCDDTLHIPTRQIPAGELMLGRIIDSLGRPIDGKGPLGQTAQTPLYRDAINPMARAPINTVMDVGVRALNGLLSVGRGQRIGLFAGSGVGKSVLLGMMARYTTADIVVVGLIGERGREVREFIEDALGEEGLARSVVVAAAADTSPLMRLHGAASATAIAEYFRDQGKHVLLIMDSLTRYAMAQREIALAAGEPPVTKGYPPSVFAKLPALVERAGNGPDGGGSITAFYTVLSEGDDMQDPVADSARAVLDGHIVLSRKLADQGHFPAIDVGASASRVMPLVVSTEHLELTRQFKGWFSRYEEARDLISVGAYAKGSDRQLDTAIAKIDEMRAFLRQGMHEQMSFDDTLSRLTALVEK
jgi:flagellum-specific ATP synthase